MASLSTTGWVPQPRYDGEKYVQARLESSILIDGPWVTVETFPITQTDETDPDSHNFTTELMDPTHQYIRLVWIDQDGGQDVTDPVAIAATTSFGSLNHVRVRLGRPLTQAQEEQAELLLSLATINILMALGKGGTWNAGTAKPFLDGLAVEIACRAMANPQSLGQESETLGSYSHTTTYPREIPGSGIALTDAEELAARRAVYGSNMGSATVVGPVDNFVDSVEVYYVTL